MLNNTIEQIDKLNEIIEAIDNNDSALAKDKAIVWKDDLQEELDKAASDIDTQLTLENESQYGK
ncbi:MAG: hypothetical protein ISQ84_03095 [Pelagibacterales bacterium]|nr:hypothetical protein [Pelagibacterales bacterium]